MNYSFYLLNIENNQLVIINLIKLTFDFGGMEKRLKLSLMPEDTILTRHGRDLLGFRRGLWSRHGGEKGPLLILSKYPAEC